MARHTINIPIIKSSNDSFRIKRGTSLPILEPPRISQYLYCTNEEGSLTGMGMGWDENLIPKNKTIISAKIYMYVFTYQPSYVTTYYKFGHFTEGEEIPNRRPADGVRDLNVSGGWTNLEIGELKRNSVLIEMDLEHYPLHDRSDYVQIASNRHDTYKPYLELIYDDPPPEPPSSLYPDNITLNPREVIRFSWLHNSKENLQQKGFTLQYSIDDGSTWSTVTQTTSNQYYDMPANTLPTSGTALWKVKTLDGNDEESEYTSASFTLGTPPQQAPVPIQPIGAYLDSTKPISFEWHFTGGTPGETQSKFDLQYSINGGSTWTTITETTTNKFKELPANTFNITGNITWRVRTYNNFDEVSPYSENKTFYVISSPPIPQITDVSNNTRPIIKWTSQGQHVYELQIIQNDKVIIDTGAIPSVSDREYKSKEYLKDGNYKVRLRVINEYNLYSPRSEKSFTISTIKPQKPSIRLFSSEYSIVIRTEETSFKTLVYRDNKLIGEIEEGYFEDHTGENKKEYKYFIRVLDENDNFNDSDIKIGRCRFRDNTLALANEPDKFIKLKYGFNSEPKKITNAGNVGSLIYFDGREYPATEFAEFKKYAKTLSFFIRSKRELDKLIELIDKKQTLLYRDSEGENICGTTFSIDYEKTTFGYDANFTITKTSDYYD